MNMTGVNDCVGANNTVSLTPSSKIPDTARDRRYRQGPLRRAETPNGQDDGPDENEGKESRAQHADIQQELKQAIMRLRHYQCTALEISSAAGLVSSQKPK